jgi:hypothetical protein
LKEAKAAAFQLRSPPAEEAKRMFIKELAKGKNTILKKDIL